MRVAVTGSSGFIGRHVVAELMRRRVTFVAASRNSSHPFLDIHKPPPNIFDLLGRPDVLLHLAWGGLPNYESRHHFESELPAHLSFLRLLLDAGLSCLVVSGTCFEYGTRPGPLSEHMKPLPNTPYGFAKDALRCYLELLKSRRHFALTWARIFYTYGSGQPKHSLYAQLEKAADRGDLEFRMSRGDQVRDYLHVKTAAGDLVDLALQKADAGILNICSGRPTTIKALAEQWINENQWKIALKLGHYPYPPHEPMAFWGDTTKAASHLPRFSEFSKGAL